MAKTSIACSAPAWFVIFILATAVVGTRIYLRLQGSKKKFWKHLHTDDRLLIASWVLITAFFMGWVGVVAELRLGERGIAEMFKSDQKSAISFLKALYALPVIRNVGEMLAKISLLAFYWSLYNGEKRLKPFYAAFVTLFAISHIMMFFWSLFGCVPLQGRWSVVNIRAMIKDSPSTSNESTIGRLLYSETKCEDTQDAVYVLDLLVDVGLVGWAVPLLRSLGLGRWDIPGLAVLFSLLAMAVVSSTMQEVEMVSNRDVVATSTWSFAEACICLMIASLPPLRGPFACGLRIIYDKIRNFWKKEELPFETRNSYASTNIMVCKGLPEEDYTGNSASCRSSMTSGMVAELRRLEREMDMRDDAKTVRSMSIVIGRSVTIEEAERTSTVAIPPVPQLPPSRAGSMYGGSSVYGW